MDIASAKQQVKDTVEAYLEKDDAGMPVIPISHQRPVFLLGAPGIGKTAIMEQVAQELGIGIISYSMTHHTRQSALGLPRIEHKHFDEFEFEVSEYTMSEIVASIYDYMERTNIRCGILFLDEINCVSETLYPSMLQFLQFKKFGNHRVPDDWVIVCAGNPVEYNRSVHEFDIVTLDRLREIFVEPDYAVWKEYATEVGIHPAITTFLDVKKDCFYLVEGRAGGGKSFVTARGWEDLSFTISLYERMGKPITRDLIAQFLHDDEVVDQFSVYFALFEKYRSDYKVETILSGDVSDTIRNRAKEAPFDERVALVSLILEMLGSNCKEVLDQESMLVVVRDVLRDAKPEFLSGANMDVALAPKVSDLESTLARKAESGTMPTAKIQQQKLAIEFLKGLMAQCALEHTKAGQQAFTTIEREYKSAVAQMREHAASVSDQLDCAIDFIEECMSNREMLVFLAELNTARATTQFVARYGSDKYYSRNEGIAASGKEDLSQRADALRDSSIDAIEESDDMQLSNGVDLGGNVSEGRCGIVESAPSASIGGDPIPTSMVESLQDYYSNKQFEYGFASVCKMNLPTSDLKGKKVLDIGCRRGRGVYKISAMVGNDGEAWGIDWSPEYVQEASEGCERAWHDSHLAHNNMEIRFAYPEDLMGASIGSHTMDVVYVNNVITLFFDQAAALQEFSRVLKPGGLLVLETVVSDRIRPTETIAAAKEIGNSVQAALTAEEVYSMLDEMGFERPERVDEYEVSADQGYKPGEVVETVPDDSGAEFRAVTYFVRKK